MGRCGVRRSGGRPRPGGPGRRKVAGRGLRPLPPAPPPPRRVWAMGRRGWLAQLGGAGRGSGGAGSGAVGYGAPAAAPLPEGVAERLLRDGFVVLPGLVSPAAAAAARREVNRSLGEGGGPRRAGDPECCRDLAEHPALLDLYRAGSLRPTVEGLVGPTHPVSGAQVALRFPGSGCGPGFAPAPNWADHWHLDGLAHPLNPSTPPGEVHNFTALVGVLLADVPYDFCGNLAVFPGSHLRLQKHFQREGFDRLKGLGVAGLPSAREASFDRPAEQVRGQCGDVVLANYNLAHLVAPNAGPDIRYCVYFRIRVLAHGVRQGHRPEAMLDVWLDWPGLRAAREEQMLEEALEASRRGEAAVVDLTAEGEDEELKLALAISRVER